ncbi:uncharacterized protein BDR25DRAFT_352522 [Lindgomyces ingoldianus]|uniref:Uncharacterized protein n=1 Tax=Lindgomyces ingoldianus TaxID=673940 RepID=A0ACB6R400_9PLEO|nr:uncharacterized protein BDR25DRAFT_352522 [Lindgomyces ingoldianus]KAF2473045.1 hypothetical protein BDR25DRAFT_352522 [Lindgomyces ingoldianus]
MALFRIRNIPFSRCSIIRAKREIESPNSYGENGHMAFEVGRFDVYALKPRSHQVEDLQKSVQTDIGADVLSSPIGSAPAFTSTSAISREPFLVALVRGLRAGMPHGRSRNVLDIKVTWIISAQRNVTNLISRLERAAVLLKVPGLAFRRIRKPSIDLKSSEPTGKSYVQEKDGFELSRVRNFKEVYEDFQQYPHNDEHTPAREPTLNCFLSQAREDLRRDEEVSTPKPRASVVRIPGLETLLLKATHIGLFASALFGYAKQDDYQRVQVTTFYEWNHFILSDLKPHRILVLYQETTLLNHRAAKCEGYFDFTPLKLCTHSNTYYIFALHMYYGRFHTCMHLFAQKLPSLRHFSRYSTIITLLLLLKLIEWFYLSLRTSLQCLKASICIVATIAWRFMQGRHFTVIYAVKNFQCFKRRLCVWVMTPQDPFAQLKACFHQGDGLLIMLLGLDTLLNVSITSTSSSSASFHRP